MASRESKHIEFKGAFDPNSPGDFCEIAKDLVALANCGGGVLVIGLDSFGAPTGSDLSGLVALDPADITNKLAKYIGGRELQFSIEAAEKAGNPILAFVVEAVPIPLVFELWGDRKSAFRRPAPSPSGGPVCL